MVALGCALSLSACGGGGGPSADASAVVVTNRLLGGEATDDTRDDHECVAAAVRQTFDDATLQVVAAAQDLDELDVPSRARLLKAALECVSASELAG